jgi:hypothetical protein
VSGAGGTATRRIIAIIGVAALGFGQSAQAQVGLTSGLAPVTLLARRSPEGALPTVGTTQELSRHGSVREMLATVHLTVNSGYRLVVRRTPGADARLWVRSAGGEFQELTSDSPVTVDRDGLGGGLREREIYFRVDGPGSDSSLGPLPVFYDLVISPTL